MIKFLRRKSKKFFREFLLYHNSSLEYRAKVFTLVVAANEKISACEESLLRELVCDIYGQDEERCEILIETINEYFEKIITNNGWILNIWFFKLKKKHAMLSVFQKK